MTTSASRFFSHSRRLGVAAATVLGLTAVVAGPVAPAARAAAVQAPPSVRLASTVHAATGPTISADYFGTHHAHLGEPWPTGWPQVPVGSIGSVRLWDNHVAWNDIETAPGVYDFARVDSLVGQARSHHSRVLLVLGQTPAFYASDASVVGAYGPGATTMPSGLAEQSGEVVWKNYVKALAVRNRDAWGNAADFQVWNEANVGSYWSGSYAQMALLTRWTREALWDVGSAAKLVAPALVTRLSTQQRWISEFYKQTQSGGNVSAYVDALSFQLYPMANGKPEDSMTLLANVKAALKRDGVPSSKPIYNTEVNYGLVGGAAHPNAAHIADPAPVANVARTYLLNAQNGVRRVYWYSWDLQKLSNTPMATSNGSLTAAGRAYGVVRSWILGTRPAGCTVTRGVYTCTFTRGTTVRRAVWKPAGKATVLVPRKTSSYLTIDGRKHTTKAGRKVSVGAVPVLLVGRR